VNGLGLGFVYFQPAYATDPVASHDGWKPPQLYVNWHPGPLGHRTYAEIMAYFYLTSMEEVMTKFSAKLAEVGPSPLCLTFLSNHLYVVVVHGMKTEADLRRFLPTMDPGHVQSILTNLAVKRQAALLAPQGGVVAYVGTAPSEGEGLVTGGVM